MNVYSYLLAESKVQKSPEKSPTKFVVDDNIGESVHIHYRNLRLEFTVEDFIKFANSLESAREERK